ncbi:MAG: carbohydrate kinase [bacterium]|jgi:fructokinase
MNASNKNILCFGEVLWDNLPGGPKPGGAPMNVGLHLKQFGYHIGMVSRIGQDRKGELLKKFLVESGIDVDALQTDPKLPTSEVLVHLDDDNNPTYEILEPVAWDNIEMTEQLAVLSYQADLVIFGSLASRNTKTRETLHRMLNAKSFKVMDINLRPPYDYKEHTEELMQRADFIKLNEPELEQVVNEWNKQHIPEEDKQLRWVAKTFGCELICLTKGENGAVLYHDGMIDHDPGFKVKTVDNVGAGDAFLAGFISQYLMGSRGKKALEYACATGAFVASREGATPKYELHEIDRIIHQRK